MPSTPKRKGVALLWTLLRLAVFGAILYLVIDGLWIRREEERKFDAVQTTNSIAVGFVIERPKARSWNLALFGATIFEMTESRTDKPNRAARSRGGSLIWLQEGEEFYPRRGATVVANERTNSIEYRVPLPVTPNPWKFRVKQSISRTYRIGPFKFRSGQTVIAYSSDVMTNTLHDSSSEISPEENREPNPSLRRID